MVYLSFQPIDQYLYLLMQNMCDDVCIYSAKMEEVNKQLEHELQIEGEARSVIEAKRNNIPLRQVPLEKVGKRTDAKAGKQDEPKVVVANERGDVNGKFGWCFMCRSKADLYCKDTRHPVCSFECKQKLLTLVDATRVPADVQNMPQLCSPEEGRRYFTDAVIVFKSICKLCLKDVPSNMNTFTMSSKILGLELILSVVQNPGPSFLSRKDFTDIIRETLCDGLIKHSVSNEKSIFALSTSIFYALFVHFREHLKSEIIVFIEQIFLKILDSGNSNYHHKYLIMKVFERIASNTKHLLEIFVNYDCDMEAKDLF